MAKEIITDVQVLIERTGNKGYGFFHDMERDRHIFVHSSLFQEAGLDFKLMEHIGSPARIDYEFVDDGDRITTTRLYEVAGVPAQRTPAPVFRRGKQPCIREGLGKRPRPQGRLPLPLAPAGEVVTGQLKWFDHDRGFGFVVVQGYKDVFWHITDVPEELPEEMLTEDLSIEFEVGVDYKHRDRVKVHAVRKCYLPGNLVIERAV